MVTDSGHTHSEHSIKYREGESHYVGHLKLMQHCVSTIVQKKKPHRHTYIHTKDTF